MKCLMKCVCVYPARSCWRGEFNGGPALSSYSVHVGCRRLFQLGSAEKNMFVALYEKMTLTMEETEKLKPDFLEVARVVW